MGVVKCQFFPGWSISGNSLTAAAAWCGVFKDGTRRTMDGGECVRLMLNDPGSVERFEARSKGH